MNLLNAFSFWQWAILTIVPPLIVVLYFLKLKRQPLQVPSTYLWSRTIEDMHVNSIWQRLRNSLLMWLQLLLVLLLLMTGLRPGCRGEELIGERFIFVVDNSASMGATDRERTRLELAKEHVESMIDRMNSDDFGMLMSFSDGVSVSQSYTSDKALLKRKLENIKLTEHSTDISEALIAASGLANPGRTSNREDNRDLQVAEAREAKIIIVSDGGMANVPDLSLVGLTPEYHPIGAFETPDNVAIVAFAISNKSNDDSGYQAFARLENFGEQDVELSISLYANDELFDTQSGIAVKATSATGIAFDLANVVASYDLPVDLRLEIEREDDLAIDNSAYGVLSPPEQANVLVITDGNRFLEMATLTERTKKLAAIEFKTESFLETEDYRNLSLSGYYDLIIYDNCQPKESPLCNTFYIDDVPPGDAWKKSESFNPVSIIDYSRNHPITQFVELSRIVIVQSSSLTGPPASEALIETSEGAIMSLAPRAGFQDLVLGFPIVDLDSEDESLNTDWPNHLSFPLIMQNIVTYLGGVSEIKVTDNLRTGDIVRLRIRESIDKIQIEQPSGVKSKVARNQNNLFVFSQTDRTGIYNIWPENSSEIEDMFPVNLMDRVESDIRVRDKLAIGFEEIEGTTTSQPTRREFWKWILIAALVVLAIEWIIYNRRVFV